MLSRPLLLIAGVLTAGALALSCGGGEPDAPAISAEAMAAAQAKFDTLCSTCHGKTGIGDGPGAAALNPKPRNYTDKAWQKTVNDDFLKKIIVQGGGAVGKSAMMPPSPDLANQPEVVAGLVKIIRDFGK